jgi:hypothetical protein
MTQGEWQVELISLAEVRYRARNGRITDAGEMKPAPRAVGRVARDNREIGIGEDVKTSRTWTTVRECNGTRVGGGTRRGRGCYEKGSNVLSRGCSERDQSLGWARLGTAVENDR